MTISVNASNGIEQFKAIIEAYRADCKQSKQVLSHLNEGGLIFRVGLFVINDRLTPELIAHSAEART